MVRTPAEDESRQKLLAGNPPQHGTIHSDDDEGCQETTATLQSEDSFSFCGASVFLPKATRQRTLAYLGAVALVAVFVSAVAVVYARRGAISGFGPASETLARNYYQATHDVPYNHQLPLDTILVGSSRTRSSSSLVTDSAAGATAFSCGVKTYNGAIGVFPDGRPCGTVLEAAKAIGYHTGLVATSRITHATPASFASHVSSRGDE
ncbi:alkaline-phosphatase-like protein, partial [Blyttiomyces helicus]